MLQQTVESVVAHGPKDGPDDPSDAEVRKFPLVRSPNVYVVTVDGRPILCNRPDARVSRSECALVFYEVLVASPNAKKHGPNTAYENPSLYQIRFFEAYLKRLIGCLFIRIQY
jgi:hypothetical protein